MPISAPTAAILRSPRTATNDFILDIPPLEPVCTATVAAIPLDDEYPAGDYVVTLTLGEQPIWELGRQDMAVIIRRPSLANKRVFSGILRRNNIRNPSPTPSYVRIAYRNVGDTGEAEFNNLNIAVGDVVTVYNHRLPKSFVSRIEPSTGIFYKRGDVEFTTSGTYSRQTRYPEPQVNIGTHRTFYAVPGTGIKVIREDADPSFSWNGNDLNFQWQLDAVDIPGATVASQDVTYDLGWHIVNCQVEDQVTEHVKRGYRVRHCIDGDTEKAFSQKYTVTDISSDEGGLSGRSMRFKVEVYRNGAGSADIMEYLYTGALVIFQVSRSYYNAAGVRSTTTVTIDHYVGYLRDFTVSTDSDHLDIFELNVQSPMEYYGAVPIPPQTIIATDPPGDWTQVHPDLMRVDFFPWYLLEYQAPVNQKLHDFDRGDLAAFMRYSFSSKGSSMQAALREAMSYVTGANIGSLSDGTLILRRHPWYETLAYRTALGTRWTWKSSDVIQEPGAKPIQYNLDRLMRAGETIGAGIVTGTTLDAEAVIAHAGLLAQMQGIGKTTMPGFIGLSAEDIRDRVGHHQAIQNAPVSSITFKVMDGIDITEPPLMEPDLLDLANFDPAHGDVLSARVLPVKVSRKWQLIVDDKTRARDLTCVSTITVVPETIGFRAPIQPPPSIIIPGGWCYTWNFGQGDGGWTDFIPASSPDLNAAFWEGLSRGVYANGYWGSEYYTGAGGGYGTNRQGVAIRMNISPDTVVSGFDFDVNVPFGGAGITVMAGGIWRSPAGVQSNGMQVSGSGNFTVSTLLPDALVDRIGCYVAVHSSSTIPFQNLLIKVTARGKGDNPFGGSNNCV